MSKRRMGGSDKRRRRETVLARDGHMCVRCGATNDLTLDHIVPVVRGGSHGIANLQTLCASCNEWKADSLWSVDYRVSA